MIVLALAGGLALWRVAGPPEPQEVAAGQVEVLEEGTPATGIPDPSEADVEEVPATITVHVAGPVARPGVVVLPAGSRVADAVAACGGLLPDQDAAGLNLARPVVDGERLDTAARAEAAVGSAEPMPPEGGRIDINSADAQQLQDLPGVGPVLAERILAYRQEHGRFISVEQLQEVPGIGASKLAQMVEHAVAGP